MRRRPARAVLACAVLLATAGLALVYTASVWVTGVLLTAVVATNAEFFLPTQYWIDAAGVGERRGGRRRHWAWQSIAGCELVDDGVFLRLRRHQPGTAVRIWCDDAALRQRIARLSEARSGEHD